MCRKKENGRATSEIKAKEDVLASMVANNNLGDELLYESGARLMLVIIL